MKDSTNNRSVILLVVVAALGYFVDIYDLVLFNVVKRESLVFIMGKDNPAIKDTGIFLFNMQMTGMLIGGILWGIWGDKKGRISVLFGSILLYSLANILNAFTYSIPAYAVIRVIAGIGLAGELGAGITLVSESLSKEKRGYGTMVIVTFGALGAVLASLVADKGEVFAGVFQSVFGVQLMNWQVAYVVGGLLGLVLLALRIGAFESGMFKQMQQSEVSKGNFLMLFRDKKRFLKYLNCILIGLPVWCVIGVFVALSEDVFAKELGIEGVKNSKAVMYAYIGLSFGDLLSGLLSQLLRSRKKVVYLYLAMNAALVIYFLFFLRGATADVYYITCFLLGTATGYWAIFVTIASEQFGTNIRSTVTTTVPNFVRGAVPLIVGLFKMLASPLGNITSSLIVSGLCVGLAFIATLNIQESFSEDLNYVEEE